MIHHPPAFNEIKALAQQVADATSALDRQIDDTQRALYAVVHAPRPKAEVKKKILEVIENEKKRYLKILDSDILDAADRRQNGTTNLLLGHDRGQYGLRHEALVFLLADQLEKTLETRLATLQYPGDHPGGLTDDARQSRLDALQTKLETLLQQKADLHQMIESIGD